MLVDRGLALPVVHLGCDQVDIVDVGDKDLDGEVIIDDSALSGGASSIDTGFCWMRAKLPSQSKFVGKCPMWTGTVTFMYQA